MTRIPKGKISKLYGDNMTLNNWLTISVNWLSSYTITLRTEAWSLRLASFSTIWKNVSFRTISKYSVIDVYLYFQLAFFNGERIFMESSLKLNFSKFFGFYSIEDTAKKKK